MNVTITDPSQILASVVLKAVRLREESYDQDEAKLATAKSLEEKKRDPNDIYAGFVDYMSFYKLSIEESCDKAATELGHPDLGRPVYLMLGSWWNDTISWACDISKSPEPICQQATHDEIDG